MIGISYDSGDECNNEYFGHGILSQLAILAEATPPQVGFDEECCDTTLEATWKIDQ